MLQDSFLEDADCQDEKTECANGNRAGYEPALIPYCDPNVSLGILHLQTSVPRGTLMVLRIR